MKYKNIAKKIVELKNADLKLREQLIQNGQLKDGYNKEMEKLHNSNVKVLNEIIVHIGFPTIDKVGKEAYQAAWLIVQHAIGKPSFMKKCAKLLKNEIIENKAEQIELAYLTDRIAFFEGQPQKYGTQFDWDENGELSPSLFDNKTKVNQRRKALGLNSLEEQTKLMRQQAKKENQSPNTDFKKRKQEFEKWKKKVGWTK